MQELVSDLAVGLRPAGPGWKLARAFGQAKNAVSQESQREALERGFEERVAECSGLAFRVACGVLHNAADAEEVAQEAFLRAYGKLNQLRDSKNFRAWLVRITFRLALDRLRAAKRRALRETAWMEMSPGSAIGHRAAAADFHCHLRQGLDALPERQRIILILTAIEGHTIADVAEMLGLPKGTVKSRMHLARKQLAEKLTWIAAPTRRT